ncbi:hypothetical protein NARC_10293 [Candidatus Nitrosocosmicus arcticus]|uniref:Uncharacterized protein n=1 Tax=Candidatus Nitrosocosmicus arcticus TaxID=2035267 RepID=A0A557SZ63_9ARCH|nr:hypothetical protein NARC_10293 [Candidatus Nitrosocosmicus arcticus]
MFFPGNKKHYHSMVIYSEIFLIYEKDNISDQIRHKTIKTTVLKRTQIFDQEIFFLYYLSYL